jgi:hypothetical protein
MRAPSIFISMHCNLADHFWNGDCRGNREEVLHEMLRLQKKMKIHAREEAVNIAREIYYWLNRDENTDENISIYLGLMDLVTFGKSDQLRAYPGDINQILADLDTYYDKMTIGERRLSAKIDKMMVDQWYREHK